MWYPVHAALVSIQPGTQVDAQATWTNLISAVEIALMLVFASLALHIGARHRERGGFRGQGCSAHTFPERGVLHASSGASVTQGSGLHARFWCAAAAAARAGLWLARQDTDQKGRKGEPELQAPFPIAFPWLMPAALLWSLPPVLFYSARTYALRQTWYYALLAMAVRPRGLWRSSGNTRACGSPAIRRPQPSWPCRWLP